MNAGKRYAIYRTLINVFSILHVTASSRIVQRTLINRINGRQNIREKCLIFCGHHHQSPRLSTTNLEFRSMTISYFVRAANHFVLICIGRWEKWRKYHGLFYYIWSISCITDRNLRTSFVTNIFCTV